MATDRICKVCKKNIGSLHRNCIRCEKCQKEYRMEINRLCTQKYRDKQPIDFYLSLLGTTDFNAHRKENFTEEASAVKKELRNLGLRK